MIKLLIDLLSQSDYLGQSELIDIAKGKHELRTTVSGKLEQKIRAKAWQQKEQ